MRQIDGGWRSISNDPVSSEVHRFQLDQLLSVKRSDVDVSYSAFLKTRITGSSVLDIGVVEHDIQHIDRPNWMHGLVTKYGSRVVGIDILVDEVEELRKRGLDVRVVHATSEVDLGARFQVIHIGDVIEHVDNPTALLAFAKRHLATDGQIIVKTPNPSYFKYLIAGLREGVFVANAEHVSWVTPSMALELAARSELVLHEYWLLRGPAKSRIKRAIRAVSDRWTRGAEFATPDFVYVFVCAAASS